MPMRIWKCALALFALGPMLWPQAAPQAEITGEWNGVIAGKLHVIIKVEKSGDKTLHGVLESPEQGATMPIDEISFDPGKRTFRFDWQQVGASYSGELSGNGGELAGTWQQGGGRVPLTMRRPGAAPTSTALAKLKPVTRGSVALQPCLASDGSTQALCGSFEVFENRASRTGRKIELNLVILPALSENPAADAVFGFAGGPGQSAAQSLPLATFVRDLQQQRDIVLIDQRGTGKSNPLRCPFDPSDVQTLIGRPEALERLSSCRAELEKRADLTQYTTSNSSDDADDVRQALGYEKVDVIGGSYGSLAALDYLRRHEGHVRAVAIEAVAPPDYRIPLAFAKTIQSAVGHLFANCEADASCHKDFPELRKEFETIVKRLDREPAKFEFQNAPSEKPLQITLSRGAFVTSLRTLLYQPAVVSQFPYIIHRAYQNDWSVYTAVSLSMTRALGDEIARGMSYSVICAESSPFIGERDIQRETEGTYLGDFDLRLYAKRCAAWPHGAASKDFMMPVRSEVPALLIAGEEDPATPPNMARHAAQSLTHSRVVAIPHGTHLTGSGCIDKMIVRFIETGSDEGIDTSCVGEIHNPPFLTLEQVEKIRRQ